MSTGRAADHPWFPRAVCDANCLRAGAPQVSAWLVVALRVLLRGTVALLLLPALPIMALAPPGLAVLRRGYCRLLLWCFSIRITVSGGPLRNVSGVLVLSGHVSWIDAFAIAAVIPACGWRRQPMSVVARADMFTGRALGLAARMIKVIPIKRESLRQLPAVVDTVANRLRAGHTVVAFPEGTTWCGLPHPGRVFYPAMFQAAIDAGRPVQPLRLTYRHRSGGTSTVPAFIGDDKLLCSMGRLIIAPRTFAQVHVESLQLPNGDRSELARRCHAAVHSTVASGPAWVSWADHGLSGSCRDHSDVSCGSRGDDGCARPGG